MPTMETFVNAFHDHYTHDANQRVELGVDRDLGELPNPGLEAMSEHVKGAQTLLTQQKELSQNPPSDFDQALDLELAGLFLESDIHRRTLTFNGRTEAQQLPKAGDGIGDGILTMFIQDPRPAPQRLEDITGRIEDIPVYLEHMAARLDTPVERWAEIERSKMQGFPQLVSSLQAWAKSEAWSGQQRLADAGVKAGTAIEKYLATLRDMPKTTQIHLGEENARRLVELRGIALSLEELHGIARDFLATTNAEIEAIRGRLVQKYNLDANTSSAEVQKVLSKRFAAPIEDKNVERILQHYEAERSKILTFIHEHNLFPIPEAQDMKLLRTPTFLAPTIPAGAMVAPPPFRGGVRTSLVYLTLSEELLDEHTKLSIPAMMIHEGIPGHHLQLATAAMHTSVIRRHMSPMDMAEGWTTMLEDYMLDVGYLDALNLVDEVRFIGKRDISRIGARVAIDLFLMTGKREFLDVGVLPLEELDAKDPFVAAGKLLERVTGFVPGRVQAELNWYSQERGYPLSYLTGNHLTWALKRDMINTQKTRPASERLEGLALDRRFHKVFLESGNMPLRYLRRVFEHEGLVDKN